MEFKPCTGDCTEEGTHCKGCGRPQEEVAEMRKHVGALVEFARRMEYDNLETFVDGVANSLRFKLELGH